MSARPQGRAQAQNSRFREQNSPGQTWGPQPGPPLTAGSQRGSCAWRTGREQAGRGSQLGVVGAVRPAWKAPLVKHGLPGTQINGLSFP